MYSDNINSNPLSTNTIYLQDKSKFSSCIFCKSKCKLKCFPNKVGINTCSYEDSLWATYALSELSEDVRDLFPYLSSACLLHLVRVTYQMHFCLYLVGLIRYLKPNCMGNKRGWKLDCSKYSI